MTPTAWDALVNPTAYRRWRDATAAGISIRTCGCPALHDTQSLGGDEDGAS